MRKFKVYGNAMVSVTMEVEANDEEHAIRVALEEWPGLSPYAGNGGWDRIVGVDDARISLDTIDGDVEFTEVEKSE